MFSQSDLGIRHRYRFGRENRFSVVGMVDILNLFDEEMSWADLKHSHDRCSGPNIGLTGTTLQQEAAYQTRQSEYTGNSVPHFGRIPKPNLQLSK